MRSSIFLLTSVLSRNLRDLHIYRGLFGESKRAENCEKLLLNFNKNCFPELQRWFFRVLFGFLADLLRFHRVIVPPFALSFKILKEVNKKLNFSYIELGLPVV